MNLIPYVSIYFRCARSAVATAALVRNQIFWFVTLFFNPKTLEYESKRFLRNVEYINPTTRHISEDPNPPL